jgi:2-amino-4-hydroxy-6-hydroxymethyldihydropteridine diphosphokinase
VQNPLNNRVFLLLGTNLGIRLENLLVARQQVGITAGNIIRASSIYETAAWGKTDQANFLNQVIEIETSLAPVELLNTVLSIEERMGRSREVKWGPRTIDIDILLYDTIIITSDLLTVPHPSLHERRFTLVPLAEIAGNLMHPVFQQKIDLLLANCKDPLPVTKVDL